MTNSRSRALRAEDIMGLSEQWSWIGKAAVDPRVECELCGAPLVHVHSLVHPERAAILLVGRVCAARVLFRHVPVAQREDRLREVEREQVAAQRRATELELRRRRDAQEAEARAAAKKDDEWIARFLDTTHDEYERNFAAKAVRMVHQGRSFTPNQAAWVRDILARMEEAPCST